MITEEAMEIAKKLAELDPEYESYQGDTYCFFCNSLELDREK